LIIKVGADENTTIDSKNAISILLVKNIIQIKDKTVSSISIVNIVSNETGHRSFHRHNSLSPNEKLFPSGLLYLSSTGFLFDSPIKKKDINKTSEKIKTEKRIIMMSLLSEEIF
jgi:hypothetical protein